MVNTDIGNKFLFYILCGFDLELASGTFSRTLKGQCHEMVVEVKPWSGRLALN
jgi:hypothetical protein